MPPSDIHTPVTPLLQIAAWIFQILTGIATSLILGMNMATTARLKRADILMECNRRYDSLMDTRHNLMAVDTPKPEDVNYFYRKFWLFQWNQYTHWCDGHVEDHVFKLWLNSDKERYEEKGWSSIGGVSFKQSWENVSQSLATKGYQLGNEQTGAQHVVTDKVFVSFMNKFMTANVILDINKLYKDCRYEVDNGKERPAWHFW